MASSGQENVIKLMVEENKNVKVRRATLSQLCRLGRPLLAELTGDHYRVCRQRASGVGDGVIA